MKVQNGKVCPKGPSEHEQVKVTSIDGSSCLFFFFFKERDKKKACRFQLNSQRAWQSICQAFEGMDQKEKVWQKTLQRIKYLETELDECRTQIFKSIPIHGVSDTWILGEYSLLRENISNWVEGFPEIDNFTLEIKRHYMPIRGLPASFSEGFSAAQSKILTQYSFGNLWDQMFNKLNFGAPPQDLQFLESLRHGLDLMEAKKSKILLFGFDRYLNWY